MAKRGWRGHSGHEALRNAESHSQPLVDYSLFKRDLLTGLSRVLLSLCDTFAFQSLSCTTPASLSHGKRWVHSRGEHSNKAVFAGWSEEANLCLPTTQLLSLSPASSTGTALSGEHHTWTLPSFRDFTADGERMG